jgi:pyruvate kinase
MRQPARRSKIVCTLGPSVASADAILKLIEKGMDVARINFSHGTHETHGQVIRWVREASEKLNIPVAILGDLQGPKIRTGKYLPEVSIIENSKPVLPLKEGQKLWFTGIEIRDVKPGDGSEAKPITISYPRLAQDLRPGDTLLFDDGLIRMSVLLNDPARNLLQAQVINGRVLGENKGVNMPGARLSTLGITEKDWEDILFAIKQDVDFLALSFVRSAREIRNLRGFLDQKKAGVHVIAKIEMAEAIENFDDILNHVDGVMVARGDLGVEIGNENVPMVQKDLIARCRRAGKPVITATQMLMSMVENPSPSRAEASDVANAVLDGSDALMLSNETASGRYPFEAVETMSVIIQGAERLNPAVRQPWSRSGETEVPGVSEAIEAAATLLATSIRARCLACLTRSGQAARQLAKYRPRLPIYAFAENPKTRAQLCLCWGVSVIPWREVKLQDYTIFEDLLKELGRLQLVRDDDYAVMTAGIPTSFQVGTTNTVVVKRYPPTP